jgi:ribosomal protein L11 methyltransferase
MSTYFRVRLHHVPAHLEDIVTTHSFECGALGVSEALAYTQPDLTYDPRLTPVKSHELDVFFSQKPTSAFFTGLKELDSRMHATTIEEVEKDWLAEWKKGFKPFPLVGSYWVVPSWEPVPEECKFPIRIDPGMAFGTGTHPTTQMMANFIFKLSEKFKGNASSWSLLDVGTGTGILAMLALQCGFEKVIGLEIDPEARRTARQNIAFNKMEKIDIPDSQLDTHRNVHQVVVANIIDGVLLQIKHDLMKALAPDGHLLLTGILQEHEDEFYRDFIEVQNLRLIRRLEKDEWIGFWVQRK